MIFGREDCVHLVRLSAAGLAVVIAYNVLTELFSSLRLFRLVSILQFVHSLLFAVLAMSLVLWWRCAADSVVIAYAAACLSAAWPPWSGCGAPGTPCRAATSRLSQRTLLAKLMPFAIWVWATDWLTNVFDIVARYMIVHHSGLDAAEALAQVGNYHSARVVPVLLVTIAGMLASAALPHLSHDWERGDRRARLASDQPDVQAVTLRPAGRRRRHPAGRAAVVRRGLRRQVRRRAGRSCPARSRPASGSA